MKWMIRLVGVLATFLVVMNVYAQIGVVTEVSGDVTVQRDGDQYNLAPGVELYSKDIIRSDSDASAQFEMDDGSMISISSNAEVKIADYKLREDKSVVSATIDLVSGWLRFAVVKLRERDSAYSFNMPTAVLGVRGTEGIIEVTGSGETAATQVMLEEGEVELAEKIRKGRFSGQKIRLKPGQFAERKFGRILLKRAKMSAAFKKRIPARLKTKLKRRIKLLKRRGVSPRKIKKIIRSKLKQQKLKRQLRNQPEKRQKLIRNRLNQENSKQTLLKKKIKRDQQIRKAKQKKTKERRLKLKRKKQERLNNKLSR